MPGVSLLPGGVEVPLQAVRPVPPYSLYAVVGTPWYRHPVTEEEETPLNSYVPYRGDGPRAVHVMQRFAESIEEEMYDGGNDDGTSIVPGLDLSDSGGPTTTDDSDWSDDPELPRLLQTPPMVNPAFFRLPARRRRAAMRAAVVAAAAAVEAAAAAAHGRDADWAAAARGGVPATRCGVPAAATLLAVAPAVADALTTTPAAATAAARVVIRRSAAAARAVASAAAAAATEALPLAVYDWPEERSADGWWRADPLARAYCRPCGVYGCHRHHEKAAALPSAPINDPSRRGLCPRRVHCTCTPSGRRGGGAACTPGGGAKLCPCVAALRECDPDACGACGAGLSVERRRERAALAALPLGSGGGGGASPSSLSLRACANVAVQLRLRVPTVLGRSTVAGFGLFAAAPLRRHAFVGEYVGEVLDKRKAGRRDDLVRDEPGGAPG
ncbi:hypothetical protein I4F81_005853 [Pyropia yezoensis]|uniref:Uncharacterized protein n=1 Tax=Pyropia yezoensis TaxID=2788 RepID=A0ACC3BZA7_PYRYE|nr:hypothetical protein I4F81_005853 [Neopyropia yezoensis]